MKNERQLRILAIIAERPIHTQEEMRDALLAEGFSVTQATVSRDIKYLHLQKMPDKDGQTRYAVLQSEVIRQKEMTEKYRAVLKEVILSAVPAGNIGVIKTLPGTASAAGAAFESSLYENIIGTLAGDDTLLCLFASDTAAAEFCRHVNLNFIGK